MVTSQHATDGDRIIPEPPIKQAMNLTARTFDRRTMWYRNLVIGFVALPTGCGIAALMMRLSWYPLLGLLFLVPMCGSFFWLDGWLVRCWQQGVLVHWIQGELDLPVFIQAVTAIRHLPRKTLQGLIAVLPAETGTARGDISQSATRQAVARACDVIQRCQLDRIAGRTLASTAIVLSIVIWPVLGKAFALSGLAAGLIMNSAAFITVPLRLRALSRMLASREKHARLEYDYLIDTLHHLDWGSVSKRRKIGFLNTLKANPAGLPKQPNQAA